jgi:Ca2+-binding RTX toxin-like protein
LGGAGVSLAGIGSIANTGTIAGGQGGTGGYGHFGVAAGAGGVGGAGVSLAAGGSIANSGTIAGGQGGRGGFGGNGYGAAGAAGYGIDLAAGGSVVNGSAGSGGNTALISGGIGILAAGTAGATVTNFGSIVSTGGTGGTAVQFANASSDLILEGGSTLVGEALGGGGMLDLGSAGGAGTISGVGTSFVNFATVTVDANASWLVKGPVTGSETLVIDSNATLELGGASAAPVNFAGGLPAELKLDMPGSFTGGIGGLALGDAIDLAATTAKTATLSGSSTLTVTTTGAPLSFQVGGALSGLQFAITADGHGGSDLILVPSLGNGNVNDSFGNANTIVAGGNGNDAITGGNGKDAVTLGDGNDKVTLGNGSDTVSLGNGKDTVKLGNGNNTVSLGNGTDTVTVGNGANAINLGTGHDTVSAGTGSDLLVFSAPQSILTLTQPILTMAFSSNDQLVFDNSGFDLGVVDNGTGTSTPKAIDASLFGTFPSVGTSADRFAYNQSAGNLFYSANGSGASETLIAHLTTDPHLTAANLFFIK